MGRARARCSRHGAGASLPPGNASAPSSAKRDLAGIVVYDPLNVRYATDSTDMQLWCMHNAVRYAFVATDGPVILWDFHNCEHLSWHLELIDEIRHGTAWLYYEAGEHRIARAKLWAAEIADILKRCGGGNRRLAVDSINPDGVGALAELGIAVHSGEEVMEHARTVKCADELKAMRRAIAACEASMRVMENALRPGMTENDLWAILHAENIRRGGEWIETRLLASGPRTNPWFQECFGARDRGGRHRRLRHRPDRPLRLLLRHLPHLARRRRTADQRAARALRAWPKSRSRPTWRCFGPAAPFASFRSRRRACRDDYLPNRYSVLFHGVGLCDEYPAVPYPEDWERSGYDGVLEPGMIVCVESYVGRHGGHEGVKLEEQVLITDTGYEQLSRYPRDARLSAGG